MRVINALRRLTLVVLAVPVLAIVIDTVFRYFHAQAANPVVGTVRQVQSAVTPPVVLWMFPDQQYYQTAALALAFYGILVLGVTVVFRLIAAVAARVVRPRRAKHGRAKPQKEEVH
ncbi:MAG: hypothetical protein ACRDTT_14795 [Pseudonocardiaceae bacterium]